MKTLFAALAALAFVAGLASPVMAKPRRDYTVTCGQTCWGEGANRTCSVSCSSS
jgi:hypothetical protein